MSLDTERRTPVGVLSAGNEYRPVYQSDNVWVCNNGGVEETEEIAILGGWILSGWRKYTPNLVQDILFLKRKMRVT